MGVAAVEVISRNVVFLVLFLFLLFFLLRLVWFVVFSTYALCGALPPLSGRELSHIKKLPS